MTAMPSREGAVQSLKTALCVSANGYGAVTVDEASLRAVLDSLSTPPAEDVREAAETFATHIGWSWDSLEPIWQRAFTEAARKVLARPHGTVTDAERSAINGALIEGLPMWTSKLEEHHARKALLDRIVRALETTREVRP